MSADYLSLTFSALADPTRRAILARLVQGESSVNALAKPFKISLPGISKHLKVLERAGLIVRSREAQWRPCRLQAAPLKDVAAWTEGYRQHWEQSFDRLGEYLAEIQSKEKKNMEAKNDTPASEFTITRVFDAPRQLVWDAWTQAERLAEWWGPKGFTMKVAKLDLRPGGTFHYSMATPDGHEMWGKFVYQEITPPERLVLVNSFSDAAGNITRAPFSGDWPLEVRNVMTLVESAGKTMLVLKGSPINATEAERRKFDSFHESMNQGFGGTFDQLSAYLAKK